MIDTNIQNFVFFSVVNFLVFLFFIIRVVMIRIDMAKAITPPSFEGMDRRIT
jgi:F0F1-type ATP synthase membrane subunit b/b'